MENDDSLRFPIGESPTVASYNAVRVRDEIAAIAALPRRLSALVRGADGEKLRQVYRPGGWTGVQVLHHIADSHINSFCRFKLTLTEDNPIIKPYQEEKWAMLEDYSEELVDTSLNLIAALHAKWVALLNGMAASDWQKTFYHPGSKKTVPLFENVAVYAWHGNHHLKHIEIAIGK